MTITDLRFLQARDGTRCTLQYKDKPDGAWIAVHTVYERLPDNCEAPQAAPIPDGNTEKTTIESFCNRTEAFMLLESGPLTDWESGFVQSLKKFKNWSEKQSAAFDKILDKYIKAGRKPPEIAIPEDLSEVPF